MVEPNREDLLRIHEAMRAIAENHDSLFDMNEVTPGTSRFSINFARLGIEGEPHLMPVNAQGVCLNEGEYFIRRTDDDIIVHATSREQFVRESGDEITELVSSTIETRDGSVEAFELDPSVYDRFDLFDIVFAVAAVTAGVRFSRKKHARRSGYSRKRGKNVVNNGMMLMLGPITNALMGRNKGYIEPMQYFTNDAVAVNTGAGGVAKLDVRAAEGTKIDAAYRTFQLNDRDRLWLDSLCTLAVVHNKRSIEGSEILKQLGYANPYAASSHTAMADALSSINKAISTRVAVDVTGEKRKRSKGNAELVSSIRLQPVVNATIDLDQYGNEGDEIVKDFTVNLQTPDPIDSLPLALYDKERKMFAMVSSKDFCFKNIKNVTIDDRQMWNYVLRFIKSKTLGTTILFDTMWRNLELPEPEVSPYAYVDRQGNPLDAPLRSGGKIVDPAKAEKVSEEQVERRRRDAVRKQRTRMLAKLGKMLDAKQARGKEGKAKADAVLESWSWHKDQAGRVDGVKIRPLKRPKSTSQASEKY